MVLWQSLLRAPRWAIASTLALAAALPDALARWVPLLVEVAMDAGVPAFFLVGLSLIQQQTVGLLLAWLLFAYLVFEYTHLLYPRGHREVVDRPGFRILITAVSVYFGIMVWGTMVPLAVPGNPRDLVTAAVGSADPILAMMLSLVVGVVIGGLAFGVYLWRFHPAEMVAETSDWTSLTDLFLHPGRSGRAAREEWSALPPRWERRMYRLEAIAQAPLPVLLSAIVGLVGVIVNLFYPVPEIALFAGLLVGRVVPGVWDGDGETDRRPFLFDTRFLAALAGASRNAKGMTMLLLAGIGSALSAALFVVVFAFTAGALLTLSAGAGITQAPTTPMEWIGLVVASALLLAVLASFLLLGPYSLLHWVRQFERIEPYARRWEARWRADEESTVPSTDVVRPPGLLLPAHAPLVLLVGIALIGAVGRPFSQIGSVTLVAIAACLFGGTAAAMVQGLRWTRARERVQPLDNEDRDLYLTLVGQLVLVSAIVGLDFDSMRFDPVYLATFGLAAAALGALVWSPDATMWSRQFDGYRRFASDLPFVVLVISVALLLELQLDALPRILLWGFAAVGLAMPGLTAFGLYLDRLAER